ncbi:type II toxin-antitoxin system death-on-curing family toxin [Mycobacterium palustre]|uniref:Death-on-curing protein n=1 Tax=Mycobacterium palustre TaxID=153971 RepID=A0A1X1Z859_9MYCO|nr:type II toxin-antitoxin system death-on-curing family toxin [Mycobacterium palustre]MCV7101075.1 type II toxin-antitoxin system death-on-curing family toxin [Mycobacterium palustre]ORW19627.1 death-on-curing protein [Mycobacterium palustre]
MARRTHKAKVAAALQPVAREAVGADVAVGDYGVLESALARPRASVFGADAYPNLHHKAAALLHSLARNHALVDGDKRLAWTACRTFLAINGEWIRAPEDDRFDLVIQVATGALAGLDKIADQLCAWSHAEG